MNERRGLTKKDRLASWVVYDFNEAHYMVVATTFHDGYFVTDTGERTVGAFTSISPGQLFTLGHSFDDFDSLTKRHAENDEHADRHKMIKEQHESDHIRQ
jgi:MFS-type transporter involved in bile tolerance (Atg22 family)